MRITGKPWLKNETPVGASAVDGAVTSESDRVKEAENKRYLRKSKFTNNSTRSIPTNLICPKCHRLFHARIGTL